MDFNNKATGFNITNAYALAKAAKLAYEKGMNDSIDSFFNALKHEIQDWGFDLDRLRVFSKDETQAFLVADSKKVILAFRGTEPDVIEDWITDANIRWTSGPGGKVHRGFIHALTDVWNEIEDELEKLRDNEQTIWITGHSLGGALATLAAASLEFRNQPVNISGLYTFGSPRVGSREFASQFDNNCKTKTFRFVNNNDVVTRVPTGFRFSHVGTMMYFNDSQLCPDYDESWWKVYWDRIRSRFSNFFHLNIFDGISDHAIQEYISKIEQHL